MKMSVREARAQFAHALSAAERGERVTITKNGKPVAEIGPPTPVAKTEPEESFWDRVMRVRRELGLDKYDGPPLDEAWREEFDSVEWSREIWGPEYFDDEPDSDTPSEPSSER